MTSLNDFSGTHRMVFRRCDMDDPALLHDLDGDAEVMRFLSRERTPYEVIRNETLPAIRHTYEVYPGFGRYAAIDRNNGVFLGWFSLGVDSPDMVGRPELGYRLRRQAWGRGYATEAALHMLDHAFGNAGVDAVFAPTMAVNVRSRRVMEKIGMRHIRSFHMDIDDPLPGTEFGEVEYEVSRAVWSARRVRGLREG